MYNYTWHDWMAFFYLYCFLGWCFESTYVSLKNQHLVNRGFLRGPILPIYGSGAVVMLFVSYPFKNNIILCFLAGMIGATTLEYVTGVVMERLFKIKYWDYSNQKLNYHGYICLSSSLTWGAFTVLLDRVLHHYIEHIVLSIADSTVAVLVLVISCAFLFDIINSVRAALSLAKALEAMHRVRGSLEEIQLQLNLLGSEARDYSTKQLENLRSSSAEFKEKRLIMLSELKAQISEYIGSLSSLSSTKPEFSAIIEKFKNISLPELSSSKLVEIFKSGLLRGNTGASSKYTAALEELMRRANKRK